MSRLNPGRLAAGRTLIAVERGGHAEDLLAELAPKQPNDRALSWHLALGVLRRQGALDAALKPHLSRAIHRLDPAPRIALRIGLFEAMLSRTPLHAAVDQAVELTRRLGGARASGLVNAVLRKAGKGTLSDDPMLDVPDWLAAEWSEWPDWIAKTREPARLCVVTSDATPPAELASEPAEAAGETVPGAFWVSDTSGAIEQWPGFDDGKWWIMDPAAAAVADLCTGPRILDACAAPGGKSFRLIAGGADVLSVDLMAERLVRLQEGADRLKLPVKTRQHDWLTGPIGDLGTFDTVLVDAPCTGLGVIRRHPEIRWRRLKSDPAAMAFRQRRILKAAAEHVAPDGQLIYAVCSPMSAEGEAVAGSLAGFTITGGWASRPPAGDEDAFQAFVLTRS
ncbi:MAG: 16S rRNA (cytosine967-C5)-methyltransferase [Myxococcota bacterium]|jgi:16S rRNA (cytosine967-C5)-methyltransferase